MGGPETKPHNGIELKQQLGHQLLPPILWTAGHVMHALGVLQRDCSMAPTKSIQGISTSVLVYQKYRDPTWEGIWGSVRTLALDADARPVERGARRKSGSNTVALALLDPYCKELF